MNDLIQSMASLPTELHDLAKFVLVGRDRLDSVRAEINAIKKVGLAKEVLEQKRAEAQEIAELVTLSEVRIGRMMKEIPKARANQYTSATCPKGQKAKSETIRGLGFTPKQTAQFQKMADHEEAVQEAIAEARENDDILSRSAVMRKIEKTKKEKQIKEARENIAKERKESEYKPLLFVGNGIGFKPSEKYDLLLTDPPYSTDVDDLEGFVDAWLYPALDGVKDTGFAYVFIGAYPHEVKTYLNAKIPPHMKLEQMLVWTYKNTLGNNPKDRYKLNYQICLFFRGENAPVLNCPLTSEQWAVQEINAPDGRLNNRFHAWQKPLEIADRFIRHSTREGMTVFDPFACTGTFLLAASKLNRKAYGIEINPDNAQIAFSRGCVGEQVCV